MQGDLQPYEHRAGAPEQVEFPVKFFSQAHD